MGETEDKLMVLEKELETYKASIGDWTDHIGEFVLVKAEEVVGFYSSYGDAVQVGYSRFELEPFLVKQVLALEQIHFLPPLMTPA